MGLSFTQILFTVVVVVAVWKAIGFFERRRRLRAPAKSSNRAIDVEPCPHCGAYVARGERCPRCRREA